MTRVRLAASTCLVTGGSGFIGTHLVRSLVADDRVKRVVVLDLVPPSIVHAKVEFVEHDLRCEAALDAVGLDDCDTCFHLAAVCKEPGFPWDEYFRTNHIGTVNLLRILERHEIQNLVFTSTVMVFRAGEVRQEEDSLKAPDTAYGMSKLLAEVLLEGWAQRTPGARLRIARPGVVFGEGEDANFTRLYQALRRRRFAYVGRRDTVKGCIYVKDLIRLLRLLEDDEGNRSTYNAVYPDPYTIQDICRTMADVFEGVQQRVPVLPYSLLRAIAVLAELGSAIGIRTSLHRRRVEKLYLSTNASADALAELGFKPAYDLREALVDWKPVLINQTRVV